MIPSFAFLKHTFLIFLLCALCVHTTSSQGTEPSVPSVDAPDDGENYTFAHTPRGLQFHLGMGSSIADSYRDDSLAFAVGGGYAVDIGQNNLFPAVRFDGAFPLGDEETFMGVIGFALQYTFLERNMYSIFTTAEIGYGWAEDKPNDGVDPGRETSGLALAADIGIQFLSARGASPDLRFRVLTVASSMTNGWPLYWTLVTGVQF